jgi:hypothetical protein
MTSALAIKSRLIRARPARFSGCINISVSNDCEREANAAARSKTFSEPISRKAESVDRANKVGVKDAECASNRA